MGGIRTSRRARAAHIGVAALLGVFALASCDDDEAASSNMVGSADAITAAVAWQADEQEPVVDDSGEPLLPVVFVVAGEGTTIDVGVQAEVAAATVDWATVRFADDVADTFDPDLDGEPVRDDGVMLLVGPIPQPARSIELDVVRYIAVEEGEPLTLEIVSEPAPSDTSDTPAPRATVTSATQP
ncbi:MAG TPA: hypothetical protein VMY16_16570 [Ilumatobacteraceae bacterium]|nr:hypothetical protein [Ilumatobacteraceae bacterium]